MILKITLVHGTFEVELLKQKIPIKNATQDMWTIQQAL
jgi:hypothetical protein